MTKKSTSFYLSDVTKEQLKMLADNVKRSQANMLELLIEEEFIRQKLILPKPKKKP